jgi:hypothetical protein
MALSRLNRPGDAMRWIEPVLGGSNADEPIMRRPTTVFQCPWCWGSPERMLLSIDSRPLIGYVRAVSAAWHRMTTLGAQAQA